MGPAAKRQKTSKYGVDEVKFDTDARHDFLSGFHRRKQARIRHAQEVGKQKERQAKIEERKEVCASGYGYLAARLIGKVTAPRATEEGPRRAR